MCTIYLLLDAVRLSQIIVSMQNLERAYFKLIKNPKPLCDLCIMNSVKGLRRFQNRGFQKGLQKYLDQKFKCDSKT